MCLPFLAPLGAALGASAASAAAVGTTTAISLATTAVSTGFQIAGAVEQSQMAKARAKYDRKAAEYKAEVSRQAGNVELIRYGIDAQHEFGSMIAVAAASGVDLSYGSASARITQARQFQAFDASVLAYNVENNIIAGELDIESARFEQRAARRGGRLAIGGATAGGFAALSQVGANAISLRRQFRYGADFGDAAAPTMVT